MLRQDLTPKAFDDPARDNLFDTQREERWHGRGGIAPYCFRPSYIYMVIREADYEEPVEVIPL